MYRGVTSIARTMDITIRLCRNYTNFTTSVFYNLSLSESQIVIFHYAFMIDTHVL